MQTRVTRYCPKGSELDPDTWCKTRKECEANGHLDNEIVAISVDMAIFHIPDHNEVDL